MKLVSACLAGVNCRYNGSSDKKDKIIKMIKSGKAVPICPEQLGGLSTPREPAERRKNKVVTKSNKDVTREFIRGAHECLKLAKLINCQEAILKARSPSCGCGQIYDGNFSGKLIKGDGILAEILKKNKIKVITDEEL